MKDNIDSLKKQEDPMAQRRALKASRRRVAAKRAKRRGASAKVTEFLNLLTRNKAIQARLKEAKVFDPMPLARGLGYKFSKADLIAAMKERWGTEVPAPLLFTCVIIMRE